VRIKPYAAVRFAFRSESEKRANALARGVHVGRASSIERRAQAHKGDRSDDHSEDRSDDRSDDFDWDKVWHDWNWRIAERQVAAEAESSEPSDYTYAE